MTTPTLTPLETVTQCPYCALQCGMRVRSGRSGIEVSGDPQAPTSRGQMCIKGLSSPELLARTDRLLHPLVRSASGRLLRTSWDEALEVVAERFQAAQAAHGPDAVGVFGSGALTNEKAYLLGKFARVALRSANIDYNGRFCMSSAAAGQNRAFGIDRGLPFPVADIAQADTVMLWGSNVAETMPPLLQWLEAQRRRGGTLIVVDPRRSATAREAQLHLQPVPGTDLALANGLLHVAVTERLIDLEYIQARTVGFDAVRRRVLAWTPARTERLTGVPVAALRAAAHALADPPAAMLLSGRGPEQQSKGVDTVLALTNLMLALGRVGRPASGYGCLTGQGNGQGGREHGQKADQLPGYRSIESPEDRRQVAAAWGIEAAALPGKGMSAQEMLGTLGRPGGVRALLVAGSNPAVAGADAERVRAGLARLDCLVVLDAFANHTSELAHVVLPVTQWAEEDGTMTNLEGRVQRRRRAALPPAEARSDLDVLADLARRLGAGRHFAHADAAEVFDELARVSAGGRADYAGMSYARLEQSEGLAWPCPSPDHPGTPRLFADRFAHPDGKARFVAVDHRDAAEVPDADYPWYFTTGRYREHYNSGAQTRGVDRLNQARPEPRLEMHPLLARRLGVSDGAPVVVTSRRGELVLRAALDPGMRPDTVFAPFHWGGSLAPNRLTYAALDPTSRMPEFKVCAVRVRAVTPNAGVDPDVGAVA